MVDGQWMKRKTGLLTTLGLARPLSALPDSFMFGVGNSDHQCESYDPNFEDIRDVWDRRKGMIERGHATDFWNRYPEDIQLASSLGCNVFRFSISWARVEPSPGQFNEAAIEHYRRVVETIQRAHMLPFITLQHFVWPIHVEESGGMTSPNFPALFARYASVVARRIAPDVKYWITFNEPSVMIFGYLKPWWEREYFLPPGLPLELSLSEQLDSLADFIRNLFRAHTAARAEIKQVNPQARVGSNPNLIGLPSWITRLIDRQVKGIRTREDWIRQGNRLAERAVLETGAVDIVLATLTITPDRSEKIDFSQAYYIVGQAVLVKADSLLTGTEDLVGKTIAVVKTSTAENALPSIFPRSKVQVAGIYEECLKAIDEGKSDALLTDNTILTGILQRYPGRYRILVEGLTQEAYGAGVVKGNPEWLNLVDSLIQEFIKSGEWTNSCIRHFQGRPVPLPPEPTVSTTLADINSYYKVRQLEKPPGKLPLARPKTLLRKIQDRGYLIASVKENVPGFSYRDPQNGEWSGLEIDLARAIAQRIFGDPSKVVFRPTQTRERISLIRSFLQIIDPILRPLSILTTALNSNWWHLGMAGQLAEFLCPPECVGQQDFVGFDYYWGLNTFNLARVQHLFNAIATSRYRQATVWPSALYNALKFHSQLFPDQEIFIIENGCPDEADQVKRVQYILQHIREVQRASQEGINVAGYLCWSITTNWEWGAKFGKDTDFGLYSIDLDNDPELKRVPTEAVHIYKTIIDNNGVEFPARR